MLCLSLHHTSHNRDPNTLFRGNSLVSKVIDEFMKVNGHDYLKKTLTPCIDEVRYDVIVNSADWSGGNLVH